MHQGRNASQAYDARGIVERKCQIEVRSSVSKLPVSSKSTDHSVPEHERSGRFCVSASFKNLVESSRATSPLKATTFATHRPYKDREQAVKGLREAPRAPRLLRSVKRAFSAAAFVSGAPYPLTCMRMAL